MKDENMTMFWLFVLVAGLTWNRCTAGSKCYENLGCFNTTGDWYHILRRPLSLDPDDLDVINTQFLLYTRENSRIPRYLKTSSKESVTQSTFKASRHTKFIIHGFMDDQLYGKWMQAMSSELLINGDYNVIIVDWQGGNRFPYGQASVNCRVVGAYTAYFISLLQEWVNFNVSNTHLLGHSLGAHIVGYIGKRVNKIGRITGLDPAEPYFQGMPTVVRLDREDAEFVDVIHTDSKSIFLLGLGMSDPVGHVDFFPNGGRNQPGCKSDKYTKFITDGLSNGLRSFLTCDHHRCVDFVDDSINHHECNFVGFVCDSYENFKAGKCRDCGQDGRGCAIMGLKTDHYSPLKQNGKSIVMYLNTGSKAPFCVPQYYVVVHFDKGNGKYSDQKGTISVSIRGAYDSLETVLGEGETTYKHGEEYSFLISADYELGPLQQLSFSFKAGISLFKKQEVYISKIEVGSMNYVDKETRNQMSKTFCHKEGEAIPKNKETFFKDC